MAGSRKWITRDEIADLHEALAMQAIADTIMTASDSIRKASIHFVAADTVRAAERLGNEVGERVA